MMRGRLESARDALRLRQTQRSAAKGQSWEALWLSTVRLWQPLRGLLCVSWMILGAVRGLARSAVEASYSR